MNDMHYIQLNILRKLLFSKSLKFSELRPAEKIENNLLTFHIEQLIKDGHIQKIDGEYSLTPKGKEFANRMDTEKVKINKQAKIGTIQCCIRETEEGLEFLAHTRLKHPFYGSQGYSSGKVGYGEKTSNSSRRELNEETGLDGEPELFLIEHQRVFNKETKELLEDKFFYFYRFINPTGELKPNEEGLFEWVEEKDIKDYFKKPFESVERILYITDRLKDTKHVLTYEEIEHYADNF